MRRREERREKREDRREKGQVAGGKQGRGEIERQRMRQRLTKNQRQRGRETETHTERKAERERQGQRDRETERQREETYQNNADNKTDQELVDENLSFVRFRDRSKSETTNNQNRTLVSCVSTSAYKHCKEKCYDNMTLNEKGIPLEDER